MLGGLLIVFQCCNANAQTTESKPQTGGPEAGRLIPLKQSHIGIKFKLWGDSINVGSYATLAPATKWSMAIVGICSGSAADGAGIKVGDRILAVNDSPISDKTKTQLDSLLSAPPAKVAFSLLRQGEILDKRFDTTTSAPNNCEDADLSNPGELVTKPPAEGGSTSDILASFGLLKLYPYPNELTFYYGARLAPQSTWKLIEKGRAFTKENNLMEAYKTLKSVLSIPGPPDDPDSMHVMAMWALSECYVKDNNLDLAKQLLQQAQLQLGNGLHSYRASLKLGDFFRDQRKFDEAKRYYTEAKELATKYFSESAQEVALCCSRLGQACCLEEHYDEAQQWFTEEARIYGVLKQPGILSMAPERAYCYAQQGKYKDAEEQYAQLSDELQKNLTLTTKPSLLRCLQKRTFLLSLMGDKAQAEKIAQQIKQLEGFEPAASAKAITPNEIIKYYGVVDKKIRAHVPPLPSFEHATGTASVVVFKVGPKGEISDLEIVQSAGEEVDSFVKRAVLKISPVDPPPAGALSPLPMRFGIRVPPKR